jgi:hypothetical protein
MAAFSPFEPAIKSGVAGFTQNIVPSGSNQTINIPASVSNGNTCVLVTAYGISAAPAYIRMSVEASGSITASATDTPIVGIGGGNYVRLFASPNPVGAYNIAVICTVTPTAASGIYFTPGQGGDV